MRASLIALIACLIAAPAVAQNPANPTIAPPVVTPIPLQNLKSAGTLGPNDLFMIGQQGVAAPFTWGLRKMPVSQIVGPGTTGALSVYNGPNSISGLLTGSGVTAALGIAANASGGFATAPVTPGSLSGLGAGVAAALALQANTTGGIALYPPAPPITSVTGLGTGIATALQANVGSAGAPTLYNGDLGTPSNITLTGGTGLPISTGVSGLGTGAAAALGNAANAANGVITLNASGYIPNTQKVGINSGSASAAGNVGQIQSSDIPIGTPVALSTGAPADITSILLPAGAWRCWGNVVTNPAGSTVTVSMSSWLNTTSAAPPTALENGGAYAQVAGLSTGGGNKLAQPTGTIFLNISSPVTLYLSANVTFSTSTMGAFGYEACQRVM